MSRSLESVLAVPQNKTQTEIGNPTQRANGRKPTQPPYASDMRRFSDASGVHPPPRPPPPNFKHFQRAQMIRERRMAANPAPAAWIPTPLANVQPQLKIMGGSNLTKMANLARSSPQLDNDFEKEKDSDKDRERERERTRERYPPQAPVQVDKDAIISQVRIFINNFIYTALFML